MWWGGRGGRGFGRGLGFGPGLGFGLGYGPNPYWSCRFFPWLPRGWWRFPYSYGYGMPYEYGSPYGYGMPYGYSEPYQARTGFPFFPQFSPTWGYGASPLVQFGTMPPTQEREMLEQNLKVLEGQLGEIRRRLSELESQE
ncbi:MAG: DUF5320 domain-containing protein [Promethearchaeota archaeon]